MEAVVAKMLLDRGKTLAVPSRSRAGFLTARLVDYPGISGSLLESFVTYSNESKIRSLGVSAETLANMAR